ncbi:two-component regulator propeller domain-containing protein [Puia sp. P3]|uniref:two-component regulator propeller domain-containing protein n=1 Tax=Puia sp. P3 TaxID=3423952 RepID=UPI003D678A54
MWKEREIKVVNNSKKQGNCLRADGGGHLWFGNDNGLFRYSMADDAYSASYVDGVFRVSGLCIDRQGLLWIASDGRGCWLRVRMTRRRGLLSAGAVRR